MYLEVAIIDYLNVDGNLTNFNITPKELNSHVIVESLSNIQRRRNDSNLSIGGTLIYNSNQCQIRKLETQLRILNNTETSNIVSFQFNHINLPLGPSNKGHGGVWNFLLPPHWRLRELKVINPYDKSSEVLEGKKEFRYTVYWDEASSTQMVEMELRSNRGSFSFEVIGIMSFIDTDEQNTNYIQCKITNYAVERLENIRIMDSEAQNIVSSQLAEKVKWLELKPNFFGLGININEILESIDTFRNKINNRKR